MNQPPAVPMSPATNAVVVATPPPSPVSVVGLDWSVLIPLIFAGFATLATTIIGTFKSYSNGRKSDIASDKADAIHVLVNSNMTKVLSDLAAAQNNIAMLQGLVASLNGRLAEHAADDAKMVTP